MIEKYTQKYIFNRWGEGYKKVTVLKQLDDESVLVVCEHLSEEEIKDTQPKAFKWKIQNLFNSATEVENLYKSRDKFKKCLKACKQ